MLEELSSKLPKLRSLHLSWSGWEEREDKPVTQISIQGLAALLRHCRRLQELEMPVDLTAGANPDLAGEEEAPGWTIEASQSELTRWKVRDSPIEDDDVHAIARALAYLAPHLAEILMPGDVRTLLQTGDMSKKERVWEKVGSLMGCFVETRMHVIRRMRGYTRYDLSS